MDVFERDLRASYFEPLDILYVAYGDHSLDSCHTIEDTPSGITVMYDDENCFAGAEIYDLSKRVQSLPATLLVDAKTPFLIKMTQRRSEKSGAALMAACREV